MIQEGTFIPDRAQAAAILIQDYKVHIAEGERRLAKIDTQMKHLFAQGQLVTKSLEIKRALLAILEG